MKYITLYMQKALLFFTIFSIQNILIKAEISNSELPFFQTQKFNTPEKQTTEPLFNIDLSDEQFKELDITPDSKEAQELRDFVSMLNKLSPEEQNMMAQLGKEIETKMKEDGLDPLNPDDITKWAEAQAQEAPPTKNIFAEKSPKEIEAEKPIKALKEPVIVAIPEDIRNMLLGLIKHLASLRQKAATYPDMAQKLERWHNQLNQLTYFLHVLTSPDLLKHLASTNFTLLRKNLEKLYIQLATYEPAITLYQPLPDEDDPYRVLGINYTATPAEIKERFNQLRSELHPDIVTQQLEEEKNIPEKTRQKKIKESRLFFKFIQDAYDTLKNPKQRVQIDRLLCESKSLEHKTTQYSIKAFYNIFDELNDALCHNTILDDIHKLLAQYKPEELAQAKAQEALEKKAYERSKQPQLAPRSARIYQPERGQWDEFYRQMAQERSSRNFRSPYNLSGSSNYHKPFIPNAAMSDAKSSISASDKKSAPAPSAAGQEQRINRQNENNRDKSENQDNSKAKEPLTPEQTQEKAEKAGYITALARLLDKTTDEVTIEQPLPAPKVPTFKKSPKKSKDIETLMQEDGVNVTNSDEILDWINKHPQKEELFSHVVQDLKEDMAQEGLDISNPTNLIDWIKNKNPLKEEQLFNDITQKIDSKIDTSQKKQSKASLKSIMGAIDKLLLSSPTKQPSQQIQEKITIANLKAFFKQNKLEQIWELLLALNPSNNAKIDDPTLQKLWKEKIFDPYGARIKSWFSAIYPALNSSMRYSAHKPSISPAKLKSYSLDKSDISTSMPELQAKAQLQKLKSSLKDKADLSLAVEKSIIKGISTFFSAITKSLGIKGEPPKPPIFHGLPLAQAR